MKKLILLPFIILLACKKPAANPPAPAAPPQNNQVNNNPTLNAQEQLLAFDWKLYKHYGQGVVGGPVLINETFNNPTDCHILLTANTSTNFPNASYPNDILKAATYGITCNPISGVYWFVESPNIMDIAGTKFYVQTVTNDTLLITLGASQNNYTQKYKFWK